MLSGERSIVGSEREPKHLVVPAAAKLVSKVQSSSLGYRNAQSRSVVDLVDLQLRIEIDNFDARIHHVSTYDSLGLFSMALHLVILAPRVCGFPVFTTQISSNF
jgi:hypothetical protein